MTEETAHGTGVVKAAPEERPHHPCSPSSLAYREACPCWASRQSDSEAARVGTLQHLAVELEEDINELNDYKAFAALDCIGFCDELNRSRYGGNSILLKEEYLPIDNKRVRYEGERYTGTTAGYADRCYVDPEFRFADIVDWKFGRHGVDDAETNLQGICYVLGLARKYPRLKEITVHFISPHRDERTFHTFTQDDLPLLRLRVERAVRGWVRGASTNFEHAQTNTSACLFCANLVDCPKARAVVVALGAKVDPLLMPEEVRPLWIADPSDISIGLKLGTVVGQWAKDYRQVATLKAFEEDLIPTDYSVQVTHKRTVMSVAGVREAAAVHGLTPDEVDACSEVHLSKLEKLIEQKQPRGKKSAAVKEFSAFLDSAKYTEYGAPIISLRMTKGGDKETEPQT